MVRLLLIGAGAAIYHGTSFNPTMVRLLPVEGNQPVTASWTCFNPTMVRLLRYRAEMDLEKERGFNPTMVRLLPTFSNLALFHMEGFNPTMVRLLHAKGAKIKAGATGFNPTMVRLLLVLMWSTKTNCLLFQSHNGAIAAPSKS